MVVIPLTKGKVTAVSEEDADLAKLSWAAHRMKNGQWYAVRSVRITSYREGGMRFDHMHRLILERMVGRPLVRDEFVDHEDGDGLNNRRSNLRLATRGQNRHNDAKPQRNNKLGVRGVRQVGRRYRAKISIDGKQIELGMFDTVEEASLAYKTASAELANEFSPYRKKGE